MNTEGSPEDQPTIPPRKKPGTKPLTDQPTLAPSSDPKLESGVAKPLEFGDYEVIDEIARGGMGVVYRARQKSLNREVAVKMILAGQFASKEHVQRFQTEAHAAARLDHNAIVPIFEIGEFEGHHFFSMKLIEGGDLSKQLSQHRDDLRGLVEALSKVTDAVHHAHTRGILHRDLKPANILIDQTGMPFVTDLGLARNVEGGSGSTQTGEIMGTPSYMSPEQASGSPDITTATDIYSLGAILYEILTGRPPFKGATPMETVMQVVSENPQSPSSLGATDKELESICLKCLSKEPSDRYSSAGELSADLNRWINGEPVSVRAQSVLTTTRFWMKQNFGRAIWALVIGPIFGTISGLCFWYATIQGRVNQSLETYEAFESIERPFTLIRGIAINLLSAPLLIIFAFTILFIGFLTAVFVKPKNRGADLAAGTIVGFFAALAAFIVCFGAMNVLTTLEPADLQSITAIANAPPDETPQTILEKYPEFDSMERHQQISLLARKVEADYIFQIPQAIWAGLLMALGFYFLPCVFEIWAAGPLLRKHNTWYFALFPYLEAAFPVVAAMTVGGIIAATYLMFGASGVLFGARIMLMLGLVVIAIFVRQRGWLWPTRVAINMILVLFFLSFLVYDFRHIPAVLHFRTSINQAERAVENSEDNLDGELALADVRGEFAKFLESIGHSGRAEQILDVSEKRLQRRAEQKKGKAEPRLLERKRNVGIDRALMFEKRGELDRATRVIQEISKNNPNSPRIKRIQERLQKAKSINQK